MKLSAAEQKSITALMTRIYEDIRSIEAEFQLLVGDHDFRSRIEYFHDAVRAVNSQQDSGRLSVELLAYDVSCLRYVQSMPLASFKPHSAALSANTGLIALDTVPVHKPRKPDRQVRERLGDLYQHYAVLFAALLKPHADRDYRDRIDELNDDVRAINGVMAQIEGKGTLAQINAIIQHVSDDTLRNDLLALLNSVKSKEALKKSTASLKAQTAQKDKTIAAIDAAHMNYALSQLAIFEESRDMLKKLAAQGTNLVGKFVQAAMAETRAQMGR